MPSLNFLYRHLPWLGLAATLISIATWLMDATGFVYECPYCRVQRSIIGLLGLIAMLPAAGHWLSRYFASVLALLGGTVAATQHFNSWKKIMAGTFEWGERWYIHPWMLSGFAMFIIIGLLLLIWSVPHPARSASQF